MRTINENGFAFSLDLLCSFLGICLIAMVSMQVLNNSAKANAKQLQDFELEKNAIMLLDAIVKNRNEESQALGAAFYNAEKHRVEENNVDLEYLKLASPHIVKSVFLKRLEILFKDGKMQTIIENNSGKNCLGIERLVLVGEKKALLKGVVCVG